MITKRSSSSISQHLRAGLSLVEILIALTMTLIVLGAMMSAFQYASAEMQEGRAVLEMANRVRAVENLLKRDLANLTVEPRPYIDKTIPNGYFEYVEGPRRDLQFPFGIDQDNDGVPANFEIEFGFDDTVATLPTAPQLATLQGDTIHDSSASYLGDVDDILAMTVRSVAGEVFRGRIQGTATPAESTYAEVVWWTLLDDSNGDSIVDYTENVTVFRRALVINPELTLPTGLTYAQALQWLQNSDVSVRLVPAPGGFNIVPNSLQDLANRRNRFARFATDDGAGNPVGFDSVTRFPHFLNRGSLEATFSSNGSDIMLTDVAAFDVKVLDPMALIFEASGVVVGPCSPAYAVDNQASCTHAVAGSPSENESDVLPLPSGDMINDTAARTSAYVNLGYPDTALNPGLGGLAAAAGNAGLGGGVGRFSQAPSPRGFRTQTPSGPVPKGVLNYQFNFHNAATAVADLMDTAYDTWTPQYESDGINQDPTGTTVFAQAVVDGDTTALIDEGTDGIDNDRINGPDDFGERETLPPYLEPIRAIKVSIRLVEKQTGQVRQSSVVQRYDAQ